MPDSVREWRLQSYADCSIREVDFESGTPSFRLTSDTDTFKQSIQELLQSNIIHCLKLSFRLARWFPSAVAELGEIYFQLGQ